jgi:hypothetical protein
MLSDRTMQRILAEAIIVVFASGIALWILSRANGGK